MHCILSEDELPSYWKAITAVFPKDFSMNSM